MTYAREVIRRSSGQVERYATFPPAAVDHMARMLPAQSKEVVMDVLGISSNTWLKIKRGEPVRRSIAERLATRFGLQLADALWQQPCVISREEDADRPR